MTTIAGAVQKSQTPTILKAKEKPRVPDDPQGILAKTKARKQAATEAAARRGRASTILSETIG